MGYELETDDSVEFPKAKRKLTVEETFVQEKEE